jgi:hypothetical protein
MFRSVQILRRLRKFVVPTLFTGALLSFLPIVGQVDVTPVFAADAAGPVSVPNSEFADRALDYNGRWGGAACVDANKSGYTGGAPLGDANNNDGECRAFVNCIIKLVSGLWMGNGSSDYQSAFRTAGAVQMTAATAIRGDIIQDGDGVHTTIVLENLGNGNFTVVDSNSVAIHKVGVHAYTLPSTALIWRLGQPSLKKSRVEGLLIQHSSGVYAYLVINGQPRWVPDNETLWCLRAQGKATYASTLTWDQIHSLGPEGPAMPGCLDRNRVRSKVLQAPNGFSYITDANGTPRWLPTVEAYYCALTVAPLYPTAITWDEKNSLGVEGPAFDCLDRNRVRSKVLQAPNGFSYITDANGTPRWLPTVEAYYCALTVAPLYPTAITWDEKNSLGAEGPAFDCLAPSRARNKVVREYGGTSYLVDNVGKWHYIATGSVFNCLRFVLGYPQLDANWTEINSLRGATGQNEGPWATC